MMNHIVPGYVNINHRVTQKHGDRKSVYPPNGHPGLDISDIRAGVQQKGYAPHEGYIAIGYDEDGYGNYVKIISDPYGRDQVRRVSLIGHLSSIVRENGYFLPQGEQFGVSGRTGWATGVHFHWEYFLTDRNGKILNFNNGFNGRLNIIKNVRQWAKGNLAEPQPITIDMPNWDEMVSMVTEAEDEAIKAYQDSPVYQADHILLP